MIFWKIVSGLAKENYEIKLGNDNKAILIYIVKFKNHQSIKSVKSTKKVEQSFNYAPYKEVLNENNIVKWYSSEYIW